MPPAEGICLRKSSRRRCQSRKSSQKQLRVGFIFRFAGEQKEQVSGFGDVTRVLVICVFAIYLALLAQFKHAFKPLIVFATIPYGIVGAVVALAIMGHATSSCCWSSSWSEHKRARTWSRRTSILASSVYAP